MSEKNLSKFAFITLISVYLVIIAGSVVRSTGSGMGCPDWPKCFGYYIPPTDEAQVQWEGGKSFFEGQIIVKDQALWKAKQEFTSTSIFNSSNWEKYTKHDYAVFNVAHTWTEYINRLTGAISGILCFVLLILAIRSKHPKRITLGVLIMLGMGFEAWLGKTVVDSNLAPFKITIHMFMALVIVWWFVVFIDSLKEKNIKDQVHSPLFKWLSWGFMGLTLTQIILGTQVRQEIDGIAKQLGEKFRDTWILSVSNNLNIHIVLAYALIIIGGLLFWNIKKVHNRSSKIVNYSMVMILIAYLIGIIFRYGGFPAFAQPIHLLVSSILFGFQLLLVRRVYKNKDLLEF